MYKYSDRYPIAKVESVQNFLAKPGWEMTKADAIVKKRLNPHMIDADDFTNVEIADPACAQLLEKNGGIPLNQNQAKFRYNS